MSFSTQPGGRQISRRAFITLAPLALASCAGPRFGDMGMGHSALPQFNRLSPAELARYGDTMDGGHMIPALDLRQIDQEWLRQVVRYDDRDAPGTIVVDPGERHLYLVLPGGQAIRYGVGVGREGFGWSGQASIGRKGIWPTWTPPREMLARDPAARPYANGMPGGIENPLGARALYLYQGNRDTIYRIHGTAEPYTIGTKVSSGCIRMLNHDIIDLYDRVHPGTPVLVLPTNLL